MPSPKLIQRDRNPERLYPENPVLAHVRRGAWVESQHRGAWVVVDASGHVIDGAGAYGEAFFARSSVKCLQALPLLESGAAERVGLSDEELALALASHNAEVAHTDVVTALLARQGLGVEHLRCGAQPPGDPRARGLLRERGEKPSALHNNCSGKHAGFLTLAGHLGDSVESYLDPAASTQRAVRQALAEMVDVPAGELEVAVDGCSAPTFRVPLDRLAVSFARVANPSGLARERSAHCQRMTDVVGRFPALIAGHHRRLCTDLARLSGGRLFPKIGAEAVYAIGVVGADRGLAVKIDDGSRRGLSAVVIELLERFGFLDADALQELDVWRGRPLSNWAGLHVGEIEVLA